MDDYLEAIDKTSIHGIEAKYWRLFFKAFQDQKTPQDIRSEVEKVISIISQRKEKHDSEKFEKLKTILDEIVSLAFGSL